MQNEYAGMTANKRSVFLYVICVYLASVIGVAPDSVSLRFGGVLLDEHTVMIALDEYEEVFSD